MNTVTDLRASKTLLSFTACYDRYADSIGRDLTPRDVVELLMMTVAYRVYSTEFLIHVRKCISPRKLTSFLALSFYRVVSKTGIFDPGSISYCSFFDPYVG